MTNVFNVNVTKVAVLLIYIKYYVLEHIKKIVFHLVCCGFDV